MMLSSKSFYLSHVKLAILCHAFVMHACACDMFASTASRHLHARFQGSSDPSQFCMRCLCTGLKRQQVVSLLLLIKPITTVKQQCQPPMH